MKIAVVSHVLPPAGAGQAVVIYRLLQCADANSYCLISPAEGASDSANRRYAGSLPGRVYRLPRTRGLTRGYRFGMQHLREGINIPLAVIQVARQIRQIVSRERCDAIVACTGEVSLLPAAWLASRRLRVPLYAYIFDHYSYREWQSAAAGFWARRFEPILMKYAARVIVPNEVLRDDLRAKYGVDPVVLHNSFDLSSYQPRVEPACETTHDEIKILYTGEIYEAHFDAFRNLISAINSLHRSNVRLHIYSNRSATDLEKLGIAGPVVAHAGLPLTEMPQLQMNADLLFLPLAFTSPYPDLVRTSSTTKLGEYLASGTPVLVHAPKDSFVSWYCREFDCGMVVDKDSPGDLSTAIERVLSDCELTNRLTTNAWDRACADFNIVTSRAKFAEIVGLQKAY